jgi:hypothetical protein
LAQIALSLAFAALIAGLMGGAVAGYRTDNAPRFATTFLVYLGLLAAVSATWVQSMEILPLTLAYGAVTGIVPFASAFFGVRYLLRSIRGRKHSSRTGGH